MVHVQGVANRDLKLENLLLDRDGAGSRPLLKICDFGYSKVAHTCADCTKLALCFDVAYVLSMCHCAGDLTPSGAVCLFPLRACRAMHQQLSQASLVSCTVSVGANGLMSCMQHDVSSPAKTTVGTPVYMAPEIILGGKRYDAKVSTPCLSHAMCQACASGAVTCCISASHLGVMQCCV